MFSFPPSLSPIPPEGPRQRPPAQSPCPGVQEATLGDEGAFERPTILFNDVCVAVHRAVCVRENRQGYRLREHISLGKFP